MCRVSHQLKLCTCKTVPRKVKHHWGFMRFDPRRDMELIGDVVCPMDLRPEDENFNEQLLLQLLNEGNVFDTDLKPRDKDRLYLSFAVSRKNEVGDVTYGFEFSGEKWVAADYDCMEWERHHRETKRGKIANALEND